MRGIVGTGIGLSVIGSPAAAEERERFVVAANRGHGETGKDLEGAGFEIVAEIDAADVLIVDGPAGSYESLLDRESVEAATPDLEYQVDAITEGDQPEYHPSAEVTQWDKEVTDTFESHDIATGEGTSLGIIDTGIDADHPDISNYGSGEIDVRAPGGGVLSAYRHPAMEDRGFCQPYWYASGTSMAAPQVTGLIGLVKELKPEYNPHQVERAIKRGAELSEGDSDPEHGAGRINALNTVESLE